MKRDHPNVNYDPSEATNFITSLYAQGNPPVYAGSESTMVGMFLNYLKGGSV